MRQSHSKMSAYIFGINCLTFRRFWNWAFFNFIKVFNISDCFNIILIFCSNTPFILHFKMFSKVLVYFRKYIYMVIFTIKLNFWTFDTCEIKNIERFSWFNLKLQISWPVFAKLCPLLPHDWHFLKYSDFILKLRKCIFCVKQTRCKKWLLRCTHNYRVFLEKDSCYKIF